jgi:hypothetical protein
MWYDSCIVYELSNFYHITIGALGILAQLKMNTTTRLTLPRQRVLFRHSYQYLDNLTRLSMYVILNQCYL